MVRKSLSKTPETPAGQKPAAPKTAPASPAAPRASARRSANPGNGKLDPVSDDFRRRVSEAAYYIAERRGFQPGYEEQDWLQAEAELLHGRSEGSPAR